MHEVSHICIAYECSLQPYLFVENKTTCVGSNAFIGIATLRALIFHIIYYLFKLQIWYLAYYKFYNKSFCRPTDKIICKEERILELMRLWFSENLKVENRNLHILYIWTTSSSQGHKILQHHKVWTRNKTDTSLSG